MGTIASQITSLSIVYSTVYSDADQRKYQRSASLAFVRGFDRRPVNPPHKWPVTRKMFPFDDVMMTKTKSKITVHIACCVTVTSHALCGILNQKQLNCLFNRLFSWHQRKHQSSALLVLWENPPVIGGFPRKGPVTRKMVPRYDVVN